MKKPMFAARRRGRALLAVCLLAAVAVAAYFAISAPAHAAYHVSYLEFRHFLDEKNIVKAKFDGERIYFRADVHATWAGEYPVYTENPHSPTLYEELLASGAEVAVAADGGAVFSTLLDVLFYVIFFGAIVVVFRKFISPNTFKVVRRTGVTFDDVVGMEKLKSYMRQVMDIMRRPAEYAAQGVRAPKGVLLEGAPGNGKTLFARALAGEAKVNFIPAKATDFESMFMAIGPMKVKLLFRKARRRAPCIVFIDEFDGIGTRRNYSGSAIETENTRIVTALLNELDGFEATSGILVLAATNSISALDPALIRPGRFDLRVQVPYPDAAAREQLVRLYLRGKRYAAEGGDSAESMGGRAAEANGGATLAAADGTKSADRRGAAANDGATLADADGAKSAGKRSAAANDGGRGAAGNNACVEPAETHAAQSGGAAASSAAKGAISTQPQDACFSDSAVERTFVTALVRLFDGASAAQIESALNGAVLVAAQAGRSAFTLADAEAALRS